MAAVSVKRSPWLPLKWLETVSRNFQDLEFNESLKPLSISVDPQIMVSKNCPIIDERVDVNFVAQQVTIATI